MPLHFSAWLALSLVAADKPRLDLHGDPLPEGAVARAGTTRLRHDRMVIGIAYSPDGKLVASGGWDNLVRLWEAKTGKEVRRLEGHAKPIYGVAFSPDGKLLVSNGQENTIRVWDVAGGKQLRELSGHNSPHSRFAFTPDGKYLVSGGENHQCILWDHRKGEVVRRFEGHTQKVSGVHVSPDGKTLASGAWDSTVRLWDVATGKEQRNLGPLDGHLASVHFSPDGKWLTAGNYSGTIYLFDSATGKQLRTMRGHSGSTWPVVFSPDGKTLASGGSDGLVALWDPETGTQRHKLVGHTSGVARLAYAPDGTVLASASHDHTVRLWDAKTGRELSPSMRHTGPVTLTALSPDGKLLATASKDRFIRLWEPTTGRGLDCLEGHQESLVGLAFSFDGKYLVSSTSREIVVREAISRKEIRRLGAGADNLTALALSPDGRAVAALAGKNRLLRWELSTGKSLPEVECPREGVSLLAWSPDGRMIGVGGHQGVDLLDAGTGRWMAHPEGPKSAVSRMAFSADGRLLLARWGDGTVAVLESATGGQRLKLDGLKNRTATLELLPNDRVLTAGPDQLFRLWDLRSGRALAERPGPKSSVLGQALSADGRLFATGLEDGTALVWDASAWPRAQPGGVDVGRPSPGEAWQALAGEAGAAHEVIERLIAHPGTALELFRGRLRGEAVVDPGRLARLIVQLDDRRFQKREQATRELEDLGALAEDALKKALEGEPSLELRRRGEALLARLGRVVLTPEQARAVRAVEVLERVGGAEARKLLESLANAPGGSRVSQEARLALGRLGKR
jgi:WD40 repeat protein